MHMYTRTPTGVETRHYVPMAKDPSRTRPTRITDAKKAFKEKGEVWIPSVTTILNMLDKPALVSWKVEQHLDIAYKLASKASYTDYDEWISLVKGDTREALDSAPKAGTAIHEVLELNVFQDRQPDLLDIELTIIENVEKCLLENCGTQEWRYEEYFINEEHQYAGCADLVSNEWVVDYKSKQQADKFKPGKMQYPDHRRQLAAYGQALSGDNFRAANLFICLETGETDFAEASKESLDNGFADFLDCCSIYQRNVYRAGE